MCTQTLHVSAYFLADFTLNACALETFTVPCKVTRMIGEIFATIQSISSLYGHAEPRDILDAPLQYVRNVIRPRTTW